MRAILFFLVVISSVVEKSYAQQSTFTKEDTLLGSNTAYRSWWDVKHYNLNVKPDYPNKSILGVNQIHYSVNITDTLPYKMQIDLQDPMQIDSIHYGNGYNIKSFKSYKKEKNKYVLDFSKSEGFGKSQDNVLEIFFSGKPIEAKNPPWDGGWVWKKDSLGNPWMSVACQGNGPSIWYPCKDLQSDEPENGCILNITVPDSLVGIGNGKLNYIYKFEVEDYTFPDSAISATQNIWWRPSKGYHTYRWEINNPINNYNIIPYIGKYTLLHDSIEGEKGKLTTDYWVLNYHKEKAIQHLKPNVTKTIKCFEHWFGPYPFYEDSYKIVEAPYLGMEHQSNVAYGNFYLNGYAGRDLSKTGWGMKWDFIVVHESGHEWFGNSITAKDVADNWIHEGFTSYSEVLFTECEFGKEAGNDYCAGVKKSINNDIPIIGKYGVHSEGSGDMYNKGSQVVHMIRQVINDDEKFRMLLRDMNKTYYHKTVTTKELEAFINEKTGINFTPMFNQYLRTTQIPRLQYKLTKKKLMFKYTNCLPEFTMPVKITTDKTLVITPTTEWQTIQLDKVYKNISLDRNVYVELVR